MKPEVLLFLHMLFSTLAPLESLMPKALEPLFSNRLFETTALVESMTCSAPAVEE